MENVGEVCDVHLHTIHWKNKKVLTCFICFFFFASSPSGASSVFIGSSVISFLLMSNTNPVNKLQIIITQHKAFQHNMDKSQCLSYSMGLSLKVKRSKFFVPAEKSCRKEYMCVTRKPYFILV